MQATTPKPFIAFESESGLGSDRMRKEASRGGAAIRGLPSGSYSICFSSCTDIDPSVSCSVPPLTGQTFLCFSRYARPFARRFNASSEIA